MEGVYGVVGFAIAAGCVYKRELEGGVAGDGELSHGNAVFKAGGWSTRLEGLETDGCKEDLIESEGLLRGTGDGEMAKVRGIEAATEESCAHGVMVAGCGGPYMARLDMAGLAVGGRLADRIWDMRYVIALLALVGAVVAGLALQVHYSTTTEPCSINEKWDCGIVNHSPYAVIGPVPVAAIGIAGYLVLAGLALARRKGLTLAGALVGLGFSLYLTHIEKDILLVWCVYCVSSLGIISLISLSALIWMFLGRHADLHVG